MENRMERKKKKRSIGLIILVIVLVVVVGLVAMGISGAKQAMKQVQALNVKSVKAETGTIEQTVSGSGKITAADSDDVTAPVGIEAEKVYVEAGDEVKAGQKLVTFNTESVTDALVSIEKSMKSIDDELKADEKRKSSDADKLTDLEKEQLNNEKNDLTEARDQLNQLKADPTVTSPVDGIIGEADIQEGGETSRTSGSASVSGTSSDASAAIENLYGSTGIASSAILSEAPAGSVSPAGNVSPADVREAPAGVLTADSSAVIGAEELSILSQRMKAPAAGGTPETSEEMFADISGTPFADACHYTGTISWFDLGTMSPVSGTFEADKFNTAVLILHASDGYVFPEDQSQYPAFAGAVCQYQRSTDGKELDVFAVYVPAETVTPAPVSPTPSPTGEPDASNGRADAGQNGNKNAGTDAGQNGMQNGGTDARQNGMQNGTSGADKNSTADFSGLTDEQKAALIAQAQGTGSGTADGSGSGYSALDGTGSGALSGSGLSSGILSADGASGLSGTGSSGSVSVTYTPYLCRIFTVQKTDKVKVEINIDEQDILQLSEGQKADVTLDAVTGQTFEGRVKSIAATASDGSGSAKYKVTVELDGSGQMRFGMTAQATISVGEAKDVVTIPMEALQQEENTNFVYTTESSDGTLGGKVTVKTGLSDGEKTEITEGLKAGDTVYYTSSEDTSALFGPGVYAESGE